MQEVCFLGEGRGTSEIYLQFVTFGNHVPIVQAQRDSCAKNGSVR